MPAHNNIELHIKKVTATFSKKPKVCSDVIECIIRLRRNDRSKIYYKKFSDHLENDLSTILEHMNTRWLISICDTIADFGETDALRSQALSIVVFANMMKITETGMALVNDPSWNRAKEKELVKAKHFHNGMTTFGLESGDMMKNMMQRIEKDLDSSDHLSQIWKVILKRIKHNETLFLTKLNKKNKSHKFL
jgi:hypothetical protein